MGRLRRDHAVEVVHTGVVDLCDDQVIDSRNVAAIRSREDRYSVPFGVCGKNAGLCGCEDMAGGG